MVRVDVGNFGDQNDPSEESHEIAVNGGFHLSLSDLQFVFLVSCVGDSDVLTVSILHLRGTRYGVVSNSKRSRVVGSSPAPKNHL